MSRCTPHLGWNGRLKRLGGLFGIATIRAEQAKKLAPMYRNPAHRHHQMAKYAVEFLEGNPRRVLGPAIQEYFGWIKPSEDSHCFSDRRAP
jgi:hypothetical protein